MKLGFKGFTSFSGRSLPFLYMKPLSIQYIDILLLSNIIKMLTPCYKFFPCTPTAYIVGYTFAPSAHDSHSFQTGTIDKQEQGSN